MARFGTIKLLIFLAGFGMVTAGFGLLWTWPAGLVAAGTIMMASVVGKEK